MGIVAYFSRSRQEGLIKVLRDVTPPVTFDDRRHDVSDGWAEGEVKVT